MSGSILRNLNVFEGICGADFSRRIILVTTMWAHVVGEVGYQRELKLREDYWKDVIGAGGTTARFQRTFESAWTILKNIPGEQSGEVLQIQKQMCRQHLQLNETEAGQRLLAGLQKLLGDQKEANRRLQELADRQGNEILVQQLHARSAELEEKIRQTAQQISTLKSGVLQRLARFIRLR